MCLVFLEKVFPSLVLVSFLYYLKFIWRLLELVLVELLTNIADSKTTAEEEGYTHDDGSTDHHPAIDSRLSAGSARSTIGRNQSRDHRNPHPVDALATVTSIEDDECIYGGSSTIAFVRHVTHGTHENDSAVAAPGSARRRDAQTGSRTVVTSPEMIRESDENAAVYPRRRRADEFLHCFWEFVHPVFPVIHKTSFISKYEHIWSPGDIERHHNEISELEDVIFSSTLNLVFALGCQFSRLIPSSNKASVADDFYQRSRHLFIFDVLDSTSVSVVQMLLVTGIYLQSTRYASRCWNVVGLAIRVAQSLGLHLDHTDRRPETQLDREMRRRVWHTCVMLDRYVSSRLAYHRTVGSTTVTKGA